MNQEKATWLNSRYNNSPKNPSDILENLQELRKSNDLWRISTDELLSAIEEWVESIGKEAE